MKKGVKEENMKLRSAFQNVCAFLFVWMPIDTSMDFSLIVFLEMSDVKDPSIQVF